MRTALTTRLNELAASPRGATVAGVLALVAVSAAAALATSMGNAFWAAALILGLLFGGALLLYPWLGVVFIFTTIVFKYPEIVYRLPVSPNRMVSAVLLMILLGAIATRHRLDFHKTPTYIGFGIVFAMLVVNVLLVGGDEGPGKLAQIDLTDRSFSRVVAQLLFLTFFGAFIRTRRQLIVIILVFVAALFITVPGAVTHTYDITATGEQSLEKTRALASAGIQAAENANRLAFMAALGISLIWFAMQHYRSRVLQALGWTVLPLLVLTIFLSGSRSGVLNLGFLVLLLALQSGVQPGRLLAVAVIGAIAIGLGWFVVPQPILDRLTTIFPTAEVTSATQSISLRELMLTVGWKLVRENPFTGVGIGNVRWSTALDPASGGLGLTMHNNYMLVLVEGGVAYLAAHLLLFWFTWRSLQRCAARAETAPEVGLGWLVRATRTNLLLMLTFALFAEPWNEFPFMLILGTAIALAVFYAHPQVVRSVSGRTRWIPSPSST